MSQQTSEPPAAANATTPPDRPLPWRSDRVLWTIIALAAIFGLVYNCVILLGYGPDEPRHMAYVRLLFNEHQFPYLEANGTEHAGAHTLHPPTYYLLLLPFYAATQWMGPGQWHLMRLVSLALCLASLPLVYQIALAGSGGDTRVARLTAAQLGLLPIFGMTCGTINNDSLTLLVVPLLLWLLAVRYPRDCSLKSAAVIGACLGLGGMSKATALICDFAAIVAYLVAQTRTAPPAANAPQTETLAASSPTAWLQLRRLMLALAVGGAIDAPWYIRNFCLYGKFSPIEPGYTNPYLPTPDHGLLVMMLHPNFPPLFGVANWGIFYSQWSQKDWIPEIIRNRIYLLLALYCLLALAGAVWAAFKPRAMEQAATSRIAVWSAYAAYASDYLACLFFALFVHWGWAEGGRYLLPGLAGLSLFLARGWRGLLGSQRLDSLLVVWCIASIGLNVTTVYWLLHYLNPTYGPHS